jgi:hypothetical protein
MLAVAWSRNRFLSILDCFLLRLHRPSPKLQREIDTFQPHHLLLVVIMLPLQSQITYALLVASIVPLMVVIQAPFNSLASDLKLLEQVFNLLLVLYDL